MKFATGIGAAVAAAAQFTLQTLSQRNTSWSSPASEHGIETEVEPHTQGISTVLVHGGHGPWWQSTSQRCAIPFAEHGSNLPHSLGHTPWCTFPRDRGMSCEAARAEIDLFATRARLECLGKEWTRDTLSGVTLHFTAVVPALELGVANATTAELSRAISVVYRYAGTTWSFRFSHAAEALLHLDNIARGTRPIMANFGTPVHTTPEWLAADFATGRGGHIGAASHRSDALATKAAPGHHHAARRTRPGMARRGTRVATFPIAATNFATR
eukprot:CAMPEP_0182952584 /NCGR_PEP_ID=MMETSP0105_2-20130417/61847_1 /TAXON_ID=81532 ORGANISM="Acanthoeca-like sp., Strain 10tr" /NCGR_SAMPLE_ID=MMETSP0105_2 /ASSEMBLY_ACC=CAM_ASM_000205 /LENGTH=269 /DNA_ID=CAMNT_0025092905 /DNA_START=243 /DNA_END=1051 /DNA_ORIENTATION=-